MKKARSLPNPRSVSDIAAASRHRQRLDALVQKHLQESTDDGTFTLDSRGHDYNRNHRARSLQADQKHMESAYDGEQVEMKLTPHGSSLLRPSSQEDSVDSPADAAAFICKDSKPLKGILNDADADTETAPSSCEDDEFDDNGRNYSAAAAAFNRRGDVACTSSCLSRFRPYALMAVGAGLIGLAVLVATIGSANDWFSSSPGDGKYNPLANRKNISDIVLTSKPIPPPTRNPTETRTSSPSRRPTDGPTFSPTEATDMPTSFPTQNPTDMPTSSPVAQFRLSQNAQLVFDPSTGLHVAPGLNVRSIGRPGESIPFTSRRAQYSNSGSCTMHLQPDGAATFQDDIENADGGFHYCSNSEDRDVGGVFCVVFDEDCEVRDYEKRFGGSDLDGCGSRPGGYSTFWNCNGVSSVLLSRRHYTLVRPIQVLTTFILLTYLFQFSSHIPPHDSRRGRRHGIHGFPAKKRIGMTRGIVGR